MSLFDEEQQPRSFRNYLKLILPIALGVLFLIAAAIYFYLPRVGDQVRAPKGLEEAVYNRFQEKKRAVKEMSFYYCDKYYWAKVELEKSPSRYNLSDYFENGSLFSVVAIENKDSTWFIRTWPIGEDTPPCAIY